MEGIPVSQQVVNCYYPETNAYSETTNAHGNARKMPLSAFYNGEVTYDLNGFYLNKRYFDHDAATGYDYNYLDTKDLDADNKPRTTLPSGPTTTCSSDSD